MLRLTARRVGDLAAGEEGVGANAISSTVIRVPRITGFPSIIFVDLAPAQVYARLLDAGRYRIT